MGDAPALTEGAASRASSSSSGGGGGARLPKRLVRADSSGSDRHGAASPSSPEDPRPVVTPRTRKEKPLEAIPQRRRGASEHTSSSPSPPRQPRQPSRTPSGNRTPPKAKARATTPRSARGEPLHSKARGERTRHSVTPREKDVKSVSPPPVYVRSSSPSASTKCSTVRGELGRARALAAGVKKKPEVAKAPVTGNFVLEQTQASKELLVKQRKEWMAAVKRTQDSTVKFVAQKRVAANSNGYTSEAQERAHLIRMAQDHNWMDYVKEEPKEPRVQTPPKARAPAMPKSIASAIGPAGDKVIGEFKKMLVEKGGNYARAWRYLLDPDCRGQLTLPQLARRCRELGFQENVRTLWYALNGPYGDAAITMAEVDSETEEILMRFRAALLARALELGFPKKYSSTEVPDLVAAAMLRVLDLDRSYRLSRHEFCCAVVVQKLAPPAEAPHLFEMLCHGQSGMCGQFHHAANTAVKVDALKWLYTVAARPEDLEALAAEGKAKDEAEKGSGKGKDAKGERVQRLRRVWTETPAVFQRLREEQEKKVEAMLRQKASPEPPDSPRPVAHGAPIHLSLYEDAVRRETARREASEPPSIKPARTHDPEYIDRLAQKPATKEVEEVATSKRPVNRSRLTQLVDERRLWHEDRERQRQAKIDVEMKEWEQAAAQLREEVARKSKVAMAVKKWRQMLAQVVIVAAFAPGLKAPGAAGDDGGVWQLLALAAGSTKVHLRLADEELVSGVKDRARITMAARMKLLVRFKQVEEHWGCGLDELLQDLSPDEPRHGLDGQMKSGAPFHGPSQKAVAGPPVDLPAQFVPFEAPQPRVVPFEAPSAKAGLPCEPEPKAKAKQRSKTPPLVNERNMNGTPPRRGLAAPTQLVPRVLPQQLSAFET